jgi:hypothetical protein
MGPPLGTVSTRRAGVKVIDQLHQLLGYVSLQEVPGAGPHQRDGPTEVAVQVGAEGAGEGPASAKSLLKLATRVGNSVSRQYEFACATEYCS